MVILVGFFKWAFLKSLGGFFGSFFLQQPWFVWGIDILEIDKNSTDLKCFMFQFGGLRALFGGLSPPKPPVPTRLRMTTGTFKLKTTLHRSRCACLSLHLKWSPSGLWLIKLASLLWQCNISNIVSGKITNHLYFSLCCTMHKE